MTPAHTHFSPPPRGDALGFTMVELILVVAIIGLASAAVTVSLEALVPGERLNTSVRNLSAALRSARAEAISRSMEFRLIYDVDFERYRIGTPFRIDGGSIVTSDDPDDEQQRYYTNWRALKPGVELEQVIIAGEEFSEGQVFVRFDPLGAASDHTVILSQPKHNQVFTVEVLALTGLIRLHEGFYLREIPDDGDFD